MRKMQAHKLKLFVCPMSQNLSRCRWGDALQEDNDARWVLRVKVALYYKEMATWLRVLLVLSCLVHKEG